MKFKKVLIGMFIAGSILTLSACGSNNSSTSSKNEPAPRPTAKTPTLYEALKDHKFWYYFSDKKVTKDSTPSSVIISKGNGKVAEFDWDISKANEKDLNLTFSDFLKLDDKEKISMLNITSKPISSDGPSGVATIINKVDNSDLFDDLKINIITDDTGNYAKEEKIKTSFFNSERLKDGDEIELKKGSGYDLKIVDSDAFATVYDHSFKGYSTGFYPKYEDEARVEGVLLTETGNENIQFQLDSPKDASKHITVDANE